MRMDEIETTEKRFTLSRKARHMNPSTLSIQIRRRNARLQSRLSKPLPRNVAVNKRANRELRSRRALTKAQRFGEESIRVCISLPDSGHNAEGVVKVTRRKKGA